MKNLNSKENQKNIKTFDRKNFYTNDDSAKVFIFALLLPQILAFVLTLVAGLCGANSENIVYRIFALVVAPISSTLIFLLYNKTFHFSLKASSLSNKPSLKDSFMTIFIALVLLFGVMMFTNLIDAFLGYVLKYPPVLNQIQTGISLPLPLNNGWWLVLSIFLLALLPAITEELIFRGIVLQGLRKNYSDIVAICVSALFFALMHASLQQLIYPLLIGLVFGWLAIRTGSIITTMIAHFLNNLIVVVMAYIKVNYNFEFGAFQNVWWYYLLAFALLLVTGVIIYLIDRFYFKRKNKREFEKESVAKPSVFWWVGLAVGCILLILNTILEYLG